VLDFAGDELFGRETLAGPPSVSGYLSQGIADGFSGPARLLLLANAGLDDLLRQRRLGEREMERTALALNISDHAMLDADTAAKGGGAPPSEAWQRQTARFHLRLAESRLPFASPANVTLHHGGSPGLAAAMTEAVGLVARGAVDRAIVGAVDCRADARFLPAAARLGQLRTSDDPAGLIAGEAAAFLLVEKRNDARHLPVTPLAVLGAAVASRDPRGLLDPDHAPTGAVLAQVVRSALAGGAVDWVIGDLNGSTRRAVDWAHALVRLRSDGALGGVPAWFPAMSFGDTGAAAGAVGACVAARALSRGYAPGTSALVFMSSENGTKSALTLRAWA
jgi:3-oxoacyl-[acyl-carrier-protein] synthase-1